LQKGRDFAKRVGSFPETHARMKKCRRRTKGVQHRSRVGWQGGLVWKNEQGLVRGNAREKTSGMLRSKEWGTSILLAKRKGEATEQTKRKGKKKAKTRKVGGE